MFAWVELTPKRRVLRPVGASLICTSFSFSDLYRVGVRLLCIFVQPKKLNQLTFPLSKDGVYTNLSG